MRIDLTTSAECKAIAYQSAIAALGARYVIRLDVLVPRPAGAAPRATSSARGFRISIAVLDRITLRILAAAEVRPRHRDPARRPTKRLLRMAATLRCPVIGIYGTDQARRAGELLRPYLDLPHRLRHLGHLMAPGELQRQATTTRTSAAAALLRPPHTDVPRGT